MIIYRTSEVIMASKSGKKKSTDTKDEKNKISAKPATKKPASFSRSPKKVEKKVTDKKVTDKRPAKKKPIEKKVVEKKPIEEKPIEKKVVEKKAVEKKVIDNFSEFETLKIDRPKAAESKIILRDVTREKPEKPVEKNLKKEGAGREQVKKAAPAVVMPEPKIDMAKVNSEMRARNAARMEPPKSTKMTATEIKNREIAKAIEKASKLPVEDKRSRKRPFFREFGWPRVVLALCCAATAVFAIAYFVNITSSDISLKVAAMQSGIDASYPDYVPRGYNLSDVTSSSGKVTMNFKSEDGSFSLSEESSSWDSNALLNNYIKDTYGEDYTVMREQGLTLYMGGNWEAWVNGGILYKLAINSGSLTKKQMKSIAVSL